MSTLMSDRTIVPVEIREAENGPRLVATVLQEGRAARGGRAELFAPDALVWPESGITIRTEHRGRGEVTAVPTREANGEIRIDCAATPAIVEAVRSGKTHASVEFHTLQETRTAGGVREIERAFCDAAALTADPEYEQTQAELRSKNRRRVWL